MNNGCALAFRDHGNNCTGALAALPSACRFRLVSVLGAVDFVLHRPCYAAVNEPNNLHEGAEGGGEFEQHQTTDVIERSYGRPGALTSLDGSLTRRHGSLVSGGVRVWWIRPKATALLSPAVAKATWPSVPCISPCKSSQAQWVGAKRGQRGSSRWLAAGAIDTHRLRVVDEFVRKRDAGRGRLRGVGYGSD